MPLNINLLQIDIKRHSKAPPFWECSSSKDEDNEDRHDQGVNDDRLDKHKAHHHRGSDLTCGLGLAGHGLARLADGNTHRQRAAKARNADHHARAHRLRCRCCRP